MIKYNFGTLSSCACSWTCCSRMHDIDAIALSQYIVQYRNLFSTGVVSVEVPHLACAITGPFTTFSSRLTAALSTRRLVKVYLLIQTSRPPILSRDRIRLLHTASGPPTGRLRVIINLCLALSSKQTCGMAWSPASNTCCLSLCLLSVDAPRSCDMRRVIELGNRGPVNAEGQRLSTSSQK
jgi:hypothetical protein